MASFLTGLCCALVSVQVAAGALRQYPENQVHAGYPFNSQHVQQLPPPQYQYQNQYPQGARLQGHPIPQYVGNSAPFLGPLQPFRIACNQLYEEQLAKFFPQPVPVLGLTPVSAAAPEHEQVPPALTTGSDGPDASELAQLQARFAGVQLQKALADESLAKSDPSTAKSTRPARLEQLEPDAELIPGAQQQPAQLTPPVPVNPGLLPGQRVYIVPGAFGRQPNLYGQNPLYNAVPGAFRPKSGVPLPGGYQKVYIVDPQSGLGANYPAQGFPQAFYGTQGNNQQPGVPLQFGQGGLRSRPGPIHSRQPLFSGFGQPLELSYDYQPVPGTPYLPNQFAGQLKQGQVQDKTDEATQLTDVTTSTVAQEGEQTIEAAASDVNESESAEKPEAVPADDDDKRRRKDRRGPRVS